MAPCCAEGERLRKIADAADNADDAAGLRRRGLPRHCSAHDTHGGDAR